MNAAARPFVTYLRGWRAAGFLEEARQGIAAEECTKRLGRSRRQLGASVALARPYASRCACAGGAGVGWIIAHGPPPTGPAPAHVHVGEGAVASAGGVDADAAHQGLSALFAAHDIERVYVALTRGAPLPFH